MRDARWRFRVREKDLEKSRGLNSPEHDHVYTSGQCGLAQEFIPFV
jgi:hypothetical protein